MAPVGSAWVCVYVCDLCLAGSPVDSYLLLDTNVSSQKDEKQDKMGRDGRKGSNE